MVNMLFQDYSPQTSGALMWMSLQGKYWETCPLSHRDRRYWFWRLEHFSLSLVWLICLRSIEQLTSKLYTWYVGLSKKCCLLRTFFEWRFVQTVQLYYFALFAFLAIVSQSVS